MLIDRYLPTYDLVENDRLLVAAPAAVTWAALRGMDFYRLRWIRWLLAIRLLPERLAARFRGETLPPSTPTFGIDDIVAAGDFLVLEEQPVREAGPREIVVGSVGKFWQPVITFERVTREKFAGFRKDGVGKLAWTLAVEPRGKDGSLVTIEVRVALPDAAARRRFRWYWRLIGPFSQAIRRSLLRQVRRDLEGPAPGARAPRFPVDELPERSSG